MLFVISITNVNKAPNKQHLHTVELNGADMIKVGDEVELHLDEDRRKRISRAHSACHLLQSALKEVFQFLMELKQTRPHLLPCRRKFWQG